MKMLSFAFLVSALGGQLFASDSVSVSEEQPVQIWERNVSFRTQCRLSSQSENFAFTCSRADVIAKLSTQGKLLDIQPLDYVSGTVYETEGADAANPLVNFRIRYLKN